MITRLTIVLIVILPLFSNGQKVEDCSRMFEDANQLAINKNFQKALDKYNAAKTCDKSLTTEVNQKILELFIAIEAEKKEAIKQRNRAERLQQVAESQRDQAQKEAKANELATKALQLIDYDPTKAFRTIQEAADLSLSPTILSIRSNILRTEVLYKQELIEHECAITNIEFSPDGQFMVTGGWNENLFLWNSNGELLRKFHGTLGRVKQCGFIGQELIYGIWKDGLHIWNLKDSTYHLTYHDSSSMLTSLEEHPKANLMYLGYENGMIKLYDRKTAKVLDTLSIGEPIEKLEYLPSKGTLLAMTKRRLVIWYDLEKPPITVTTKNYYLSDMKVHEAKEIILLAGGPQMQLLDLNGHELNRFEAHNMAISNCNFHLTGEFFITACLDGTSAIWNLESQKMMELKGHLAEVYAAAFNPIKNIAVTASRDNTIKVWQLSRMRIWFQQAHKFDVVGVGFLANELMVSVGLSGKLIVWDRNGKVVNSVERFTKESIAEMLVIPSSGLIFLGDHQGQLYSFRWENNSLVLLHSWKGHTKSIHKLCWDEEKEKIVSVSQDRKIKFWNTSGQLLDSLHFEVDINDISLSADFRQLIIALDTTLIQKYNIKTKKISNIELPKPMNQVEYSKDGKFLVSIRNNQAYLWNLAKPPAQPKIVTVPTGIISKVSFSPSGVYFLTAAWDKSLRVWNLNGEEILLLTGHTAKLLDAEFSPDSKTILSGDLNGNVIQWQTIEHLIESNFMPTNSKY